MVLTHRLFSRLFVLFAMPALGACNRASPPPAATAPVAATPAAAPAAAPAESPAQTLDNLDTRKPVPLLPMMAHHQKRNMRDHLLAVQQIIAGVAVGDMPAVEKAAARLESSPQMAQTCNHMGAGAPGFTPTALEFHRVADGIGQAARQGDGTAVLTQLGATLQTCTSCHETWKQQVVDAQQWEARTASAPPQGDMHH